MGSVGASVAPGMLVWIPSTDKDVDPSAADLFVDGRTKGISWVPATVTSVQTSACGIPRLQCKTANGVVEGLLSKDCPVRNQRDDNVDDLVKSDFLHEPGILSTLHSRYNLDNIYTFSGPNIIIAANPHKPLPSLYGSEVMREYRGATVGDLRPHVYAIAEQAFQCMMSEHAKQAILISGESGAGKTETAKSVMQYLASRSHGDHGSTNGYTCSMAAPIEQQVLESNPLLEAFGNARTMRNNNSSRFGKWVEMCFDPYGRVTGASISTYLLERSRVVCIGPQERSFHIFYQLCACQDSQLLQHFRLTDGASSFRYLAQSSCLSIDGLSDAEGFQDTIEAMDTVGLSREEQTSVLAVVAAVLHLGNIEYAGSPSEAAQLAGPAALKAFNTAAELLQVDGAALQQALMTRTIVSANDTVLIQLDCPAAEEARDALAKVLYSRLFDWLVAAINRKIQSGSNVLSHSSSIGILDIYGFEGFQTNSFEQLCINLANEKLQQQFNATIFKAEQEEYRREGIDWSYITFVDNQDCLDLLEGHPATPSKGVFPLIDEACRMPAATFRDLAHTLRKQLSDMPRFYAPPRPQHAFAVHHYAGPVLYSADLLLDKNKDFVVAEQLALLRSSTNAVVSACFMEDGKTNGIANGSKNSFKFSSVGASFRKQLNGLMITLNECQPLYIRCIKPNPSSRPGLFTPNYVLEQLRAGGVLEAVRIACAGFPTRKSFLTFVERYALLLCMSSRNYTPRNWQSADDAELMAAAEAILTSSGLQGSQCGRTRVFLHAGHLAQLEAIRALRIRDAVVRIQAIWRGVLARRNYALDLVRIVRLQSAFRVVLAKNQLRHMQQVRAALRIQTWWRMARHRIQFLAYCRMKAAIIIQKNVRCFLCRMRFMRVSQAAQRREKQRQAAMVMQKYYRRFMAQRKVSAMIAEARKWQILQEQRDAFQQDAQRLQQEADDMRNQLTQTDSKLKKLAAELVVAQANQSQIKSLECEVAKLQRQLAEYAQLKEQVKGLVEDKRQLQTELTALAGQVQTLTTQNKAYKVDAEALRSATHAAEQEAARLKRDIASAQEVGHCSTASKTATIAALRAELQQAKIDQLEYRQQLRQQLQAEQTTRMAALEGQIRMLRGTRTANETLSAALADSRKRNFALVVQLVVSTLRQGQIRSQLTKAQDIAAATAATNAQLAAAQGDMLQLAESSSPQTSSEKRMPLRLSFATPSNGRRLFEEHQNDGNVSLQLGVLQAQVIPIRLPVIPLDFSGGDAYCLPMAGWILGSTVWKWMSDDNAVDQARASVTQLLERISSVAASSDISLQSYWLATCVLAGAYMRTICVGHAAAGRLFTTADDFMHCQDLQLALAESLKQHVVLDVGVLSNKQQRRVAQSPGAVTAARTLSQPSRPSSQSLMEQGRAQELDSSPWRATFSGLTAVVSALRDEGLPPALQRAIVQACLSYLDAQLLNALLLRRAACAIEGVEAMQLLLLDLKVWVASNGTSWQGTPSDVDRCCERSHQAVEYLLHGKDRLAQQVADTVVPTLRANYGSLSLSQVLRLTEHHHDAWTDGGDSTMMLIQVLQSQCSPSSDTPPAARVNSCTPLRRLFTTTATKAPGTPQADGLLASVQGVFMLQRKLVSEAGRQMCPRDGADKVAAVFRQAAQQDEHACKLLNALHL